MLDWITNSVDQESQSELLRYERKFRIHKRSAYEVEGLIRLHPAGFRAIYPARDVNNLYFDTPTLSSYKQCVSDALHRQKVRVRWYGALLDQTCRPQLELKLKVGALGYKLRYGMHQLDFGDSIDTEKLRESFKKADLPERLLGDLETLRPVLLNRYHRSYWLSADGRFRLTVDSLQEFHSLNNRCSKPVIHHTDRKNVIMELKYLRAHDDHAEQITARLPFRLGKNSKFMTGIGILYGDFPGVERSL